MDAGAPYAGHARRFRETLAAYRARGLRCFASSSFQTHSVPMLHLLRACAPEVPVYFLDTGFHFAETLAYRDRVADWLGIAVRTVRSPITKLQQRDGAGQFWFATDPDYCCYLNKTLPLEPVLAEHDVWITGVRRDQSDVRRALAPEEPGPSGTIRCHPMLDWDRRLVWRYVADHDIPRHPLDALGYDSVGCEPCTRRALPGDERSGRWAGLRKTECGLHTELAAPHRGQAWGPGAGRDPAAVERDAAGPAP
jgi:phosphoadenosine phosphosulfate reductase